jgi:hypothetical protein
MTRNNKKRHENAHRVLFDTSDRKRAVERVRRVLYRTERPGHLIEEYIEGIDDAGNWGSYQPNRNTMPDVGNSDDALITDFDLFVQIRDEDIAKQVAAEAEAAAEARATAERIKQEIDAKAASALGPGTSEVDLDEVNDAELSAKHINEPTVDNHSW